MEDMQVSDSIKKSQSEIGGSNAKRQLTKKMSEEYWTYENAYLRQIWKQ